jgi:Sec-independent protein translocase protein TatA
MPRFRWWTVLAILAVIALVVFGTWKILHSPPFSDPP